jgi:hypothetical protein
MTFDAKRCRTVLFGGDIGGATGDDDTWEYDGLNWSPVATPDAPGPRWAYALAYNPITEKVVLFGGYGPVYPTGSPLADTWEYDGANWVETSPAVSPTANEQFILTYEGSSQKVLLFGGFGSGDTWLYENLHQIYLPLIHTQ